MTAINGNLIDIEIMKSSSNKQTIPESNCYLFWSLDQYLKYAELVHEEKDTITDKKVFKALKTNVYGKEYKSGVSRNRGFDKKSALEFR